MQYFVKHDQVALQHPEPGTVRRVMAYTDKLMMCELTFKKGGTSAIHSHPHDQLTYIVSGKLEFSVNGEKGIVEAGDVVYLPGGSKHGITAMLADSVIVDTFAPKRDDFLK
jgi:quercetin dioxygenase-like cupin family protein